jgi:hypothetical protein
VNTTSKQPTPRFERLRDKGQRKCCYDMRQKIIITSCSNKLPGSSDCDKGKVNSATLEQQPPRLEVGSSDCDKGKVKSATLEQQTSGSSDCDKGKVKSANPSVLPVLPLLRKAHLRVHLFPQHSQLSCRQNFAINIKP